jgi:peptide/nickel transport system ATP-binding protein
VEAGDVELVVKAPRHPYTQLLVSSIPVPGVARTWSADGVPASAGVASHAELPGCLFADRCPSVMPVCRTAAPPLFRAATHRVVACYLDQEAPVVPADAMGDAFVEPPVALGRPASS